MKVLFVVVVVVVSLFGMSVAQLVKGATTSGTETETNAVGDANADNNLLKQILRDITLVKANTTSLTEGLEKNIKATKEEKGMCKNAMRSEVGLIEERAGSAIHGKFAENLNEYDQLYRTYTPCDIGNVFKRLVEFMKNDKTCVATEFNENGLGVTATLTAGKPEIGLECRTASCYECLANLGCSLDSLLAAVTDQKLVKEGMLVPAKNYIGNHQLSFNGKSNFVSLPRFYEYTPEFTFEAWVAWEPEEGFNMDGATARIIDFFSADDRRGDPRGDINQSNTKGDKVTRVTANGVEIKSVTDMLLSADPEGGVAATKTVTEAGEVAEEDGDFTLHFRKHHVVSAQWISGISLSPGSFRPASVTDKSIPTPPPLVPLRLLVDNVELLGEKPLEHGRWQHVAVTIAKTEDASEDTDCCWAIKLYVDGDVVTHRDNIPLSQIRPDRMLYVVDSNFIGRNQGGDEKGFFKGYLDEVRLWRVARTQKQIVDFMHRPVSGVDENLISYYRFDELLHDGSVVDQSQGRHDGTLGKRYDLETQPTRVSIRPESIPEMGA